MLSQEHKIKVLIVDGFNNHDWEKVTELLQEIMNTSQLFDVDVSTAPSSYDATQWALWNPNFTDYDVVIQNTNNIHDKRIKWPIRVQKSFEQYVKRGGGVLVFHSANNAFSDWKAYSEMIGLGWRKADQGVSVIVTNDLKLDTIPVGKGRKTYHGPRNDEQVCLLNQHPIYKDFPSKWMTPDTELYKYPRGPFKNTTVLSYAQDEETGINWPVDWVVRYGKGRVYSSSLGHLKRNVEYPISFRCIGFQSLLIRATEWCAKGTVSYELPKRFPKARQIELVK